MVRVKCGLNAEPFQHSTSCETGCWVKISCAERLTQMGEPYEDVCPLRKRDRNNSDRVLWGTDWPHLIFGGNAGRRSSRRPNPALYLMPPSKASVENLVNLYGFCVSKTFCHSSIVLCAFYLVADPPGIVIADGGWLSGVSNSM